MIRRNKYFISFMAVACLISTFYPDGHAGLVLSITTGAVFGFLGALADIYAEKDIV